MYLTNSDYRGEENHKNGSLIVTNVPLRWGMLITAEVIYVLGAGEYGKSAQKKIIFKIKTEKE